MKPKVTLAFCDWLNYLKSVLESTAFRGFVGAWCDVEPWSLDSGKAFFFWKKLKLFCFWCKLLMSISHSNQHQVCHLPGTWYLDLLYLLILIQLNCFNFIFSIFIMWYYVFCKSEVIFLHTKVRCGKKPCRVHKAYIPFILKQNNLNMKNGREQLCARIWVRTKINCVYTPIIKEKNT